MKLGFYCRLAAINLRNNRRTYGPYLLSSAVVTMLFYIIHALSNSQQVAALSGGEAIQAILSIAVGVVGLFSALFLFYTNGFLLKRRKREFGMFNILGMQKTHIARVLFWETLLTGVLSLVSGILGGVLFSKLCQALLFRILQMQAPLSFEWTPNSIQATALVFGCIDAALFLCSIWEIHLSNPVALLRGAQAGEKPPRANWPAALLGLLTLGGGYYIAVTVETPLEALMLFFVAVALVIIGTFCCFMAGSVAFLKLLSKNKGYYYKTAHFVSVSGMIARMRRNGAGLASICILSTAVLVTVSSTVSLYLGSEDMIRAINPRNVYVSARGQEDNWPAIDATIQQVIEETHVRTRDPYVMDFLSFAVMDTEHGFDAKAVTGGYLFDTAMETGKVRSLTAISLSDYNRLTGQDRSLTVDELFLYEPDHRKADTLSIGGRDFTIAEQIPRFDAVSVGDSAIMAVESTFIVVPDEILPWLYDYQAGIYGETRSEMTHWFGFDLDDPVEQQRAFVDALYGALEGMHTHISFDWSFRSDFFSLYGSLFFLGLFLGALFLLATVLILYYKQVTEGYEDQSRFEIMRKVGMTREEIKKTIHSQTITVFFLPLLMAGVHIVFAFPVIRRLLVLFSMSNTLLYALGTLGTFGAFGLLYLIVYHWTSGAYYSIVSRDGERGLLS